jgi:predicted PurR-regulated permease PerM
MSAIAKILGKTKGNKALLAGTIIGILTLAIVIGAIAGSILILGINLMGFNIPYEFKTILGAAIVISCLRSIGGSSSK